MDIKTAFLQGKLEENLYMEVPKGVKAKPGTICKLQKPLYGLKQALQCWNNRLNEVLLKLGFVRSKKDYCLYTLAKPGDEIFLVLYVDELLIVGRNLARIQKLKHILSYKSRWPIARKQGTFSESRLTTPKRKEE